MLSAGASNESVYVADRCKYCGDSANDRCEYYDCLQVRILRVSQVRILRVFVGANITNVKCEYYECLLLTGANITSVSAIHR